MNKRIRYAYWIAMSGYFALLILLMAWNIWLVPSETLPISLALVFFVGPLMFPLRGLLHGRQYTFAWTSFLALAYLLHGMVETYSNPAERSLALLETLFSLMLFLGSAFYTRWLGMASKELSE